MRYPHHIQAPALLTVLLLGLGVGGCEGGTTDTGGAALSAIDDDQSAVTIDEAASAEAEALDGGPLAAKLNGLFATIAPVRPDCFELAKACAEDKIRPFDCAGSVLHCSLPEEGELIAKAMHVCAPPPGKLGKPGKPGMKGPPPCEDDADDCDEDGPGKPGRMGGKGKKGPPPGMMGKRGPPPGDDDDGAGDQDDSDKPGKPGKPGKLGKMGPPPGMDGDAEGPSEPPTEEEIAAKIAACEATLDDLIVAAGALPSPKDDDDDEQQGPPPGMGPGMGDQQGGKRGPPPGMGDGKPGKDGKRGKKPCHPCHKGLNACLSLEVGAIGCFVELGECLQSTDAPEGEAGPDGPPPQG